MSAEHITPLKPCPCCRGKAAMHQNVGGWTWVECTRCFLATQYRISASGDASALVAEAWNKRADEPKQEALPL